MWLKIIGVALIYLFGNLLPAITTKRSVSVFQKSDTLHLFKGDTIRFGGVPYRMQKLSDSTEILFNADGTIETVRLAGFNP